MNILVINWQDWENPFAGGAEVYLYEVFSRLIKKGCKVMLLCNRAKGQPRYEILQGFEIYRIGRRSNFNFLAPFALRALLRHRNIDIIIDDLNKIPFYSSLFTHKRVLPMLMHLFRSTIYRETNILFASYVFLTERLVSLFYPHSNFVAISKSTAQDLRDIGIKKDIYVVPSGIPRVPKIEKQQRVLDLVAYVGRVKMYKSIDHFIRAVALVKKKRRIQAKIVGDGDALAYLKNLAKKLAVDIEFTGFVGEVEKYRMYSSARLVVQPSIKEGWGLTAIEAQSCGTPVVCADSPGLREVVLQDQTGFLYKYGEIQELAQRIIELLDNNKKWQKFSIAAKNWADRFSWDQSAEELENIMKREIAPKTIGSSKCI